jgi:hypothetical protein
MSVIWSYTIFYNLHWNNYLYFKGLHYIWEEMMMMTLLHMAGLENSECIWKIQRKPEVIVSVSITYIFTEHSPKFTQQVSLEYQRWLAERFIIA